MATGAHLLDDREELAAIAHPLRLQILDGLREPDSAAGVARRLGEPRQRINHHVKELARVGLLLPAGERRRGNFTEQLYEAVAGSFVVSPRLMWADERRRQALAQEISLEHLVQFGERLQRRATELLDGVAFDGDSVASATVETSVRFGDAAARAAFLDEYLRLVADLVERHATTEGPGYHLGLVALPMTEEQQ
ncbi:MAG: helix-turn-helix domain-containing protein [Acidimicrobiales bacterium]